jgi:hypothetical protein
MTDSIINFIFPLSSTHHDFLHFQHATRPHPVRYIDIPCTLGNSVAELALHYLDFSFLGRTEHHGIQTLKRQATQVQTVTYLLFR